MEKKYNTRSPAVKRLMREAAELCNPTSEFSASPLEDNLFEWHFTVRGPEETDFQGGVYHGRILVPAEYPMKPPDIIVLTPNGRFEVGKKICLSISGHHPETWQPSWSIRTALLAIIGFMPTPAQGTIGSLDYSPEERRALARRSVDWSCSLCGVASSLLLPPGQEDNKTKEEVEQIVNSVQFKSEEEMAKDKTEKKVLQEKDNTTTKSGEVSANSDNGNEANIQNEESISPGVCNSSVNSSVDTKKSSTSKSGEEQQLTESSRWGMQVSDLMIMLLVAAIGAIIFRRFNLMQDSAGESLLDEQQ